MPKEITIPVGWLKRLDDLTSKYVSSPLEEKERRLNYLIGYLEGVKFLLK